MNKTLELMCAHSILVCCFFLALGFFGVAGWMPLVPPEMTADALSAMFEDDRMRIKFGATLLGFSSMFYWSFAAAVATQLKRIEGRHSPMTRLEMVASNGTAMAIMFLAFLILSMTYRPDIEPTALQLANDFMWLVFVGLYPPGVMQNLAIGFAILSDKNEKKIYPRWVAFVNLWVAFLFLPGGYIAFFSEGPFSWDGILGFWPVGIGFFLWAVVMWYWTVKAIQSSED
jgi:hypothetical protein